MMPVFEGLLPFEDDQTVADMLFELSNWHALANLRMHHDVTLDNLEKATQHMYEGIRIFTNTTCERLQAPELPSEADTRHRRTQAQKSKTKINRKTQPRAASGTTRSAQDPGPAEPSTGQNSQRGDPDVNAGGSQAARASPDEPPAPAPKTKRTVKFTVMNTPKFHFLGDYVEYIRRSGPTDNYSTQVVSTLMVHPRVSANPLAGRTRTSSRQASLLPHQPRTLRPPNGAKATEHCDALSLARERCISCPVAAKGGGNA